MILAFDLGTLSSLNHCALFESRARFPSSGEINFIVEDAGACWRAEGFLARPRFQLII